MMRNIQSANAAAFATFRSEVSALRNDGLDVRLLYVPGNHDRLVNVYGPTRALALETLGIEDDGSELPDRFYCARHGVIALHGHQFDAYNHEAPTQQNPDGAPIGDPLTTELISRIPGCVEAAVRRKDPTLSEREIRCIRETFESLEDVRPLSSVIEWLLSHVRKSAKLESAVHDAVDEAIQEFKGVPFVKDWFEEHDSWNPNDDADRLQWVLWIAGQMSLRTASRITPPLVRLSSALACGDPYAQEAGKLIRCPDQPARLVVMGHTHTATQEALAVAPGTTRRTARSVYLNTGTWRPCHHRCADGSGFLAWREMTYVLAYAPTERLKHGLPSFETWSGTLDTRGPSACEASSDDAGED